MYINKTNTIQTSNKTSYFLSQDLSNLITLHGFIINRESRS